MKLVILESPFAGKSRFWIVRKFQQWSNVRYARRCVRHSLCEGEAPIASHLLYTQRGILNDDRPHEREIGIRAGHAWRHSASKFVVYVDRGISIGMEAGIQIAKDAGIPVEYRSLNVKVTNL